MKRRDALAFWIRSIAAGRAAEPLESEANRPKESEAPTMTMLTLFKLLLDDFVRYRWRDLVALALIGAGVSILIYSQDPGARDEAKAIIGAGLIMLDPRGMLPGARPAEPPGNGTAPPAVPTSAKAELPPGWGAGK